MKDGGEQQLSNAQPSGWDAWLRRHGPALLLYARQWAPCRADAEEAVQEGFVRFWRAGRGGAPGALPLLYTCVKRSALDLVRRQTRRSAREAAAHAGAPDADPWFETSLERREREAAVEAGLRALPAEQREVLTLKMWGGLTFREVAETLGVPLNTAASRYRYAIAALRERLAAEAAVR
jgi:RNA polymerase sigma-70 factor (ECF subfamily)